jgi:hypothetical protein
MYRINEDVAKSNKVLKEIDSLRINQDEIDKVKNVIDNLKEYLVKQNSVGYLGMFTQMAYNMVELMYFSERGATYERSKYDIDQRVRKNFSAKYFKLSQDALLSDFILIFKKIQENKDIIKNLRNRNGDLVKIEDCETLHKLEDCLHDLSRWRTFNNFIKGFPKAQKDLIWENGYFKNDVKDRYKLYQAVEMIFKKSKQDVFLKKVSNIKTTKDMIHSIISMGVMGIPWDINDYLTEIEKSKDVKIIYNKNNYLILKINSSKEVMKYCGDTAWCIRSEHTFKSYYRQGDFFAVLNFNKNSSDRLSKIGITYSKGIIYHCQDKFDARLNPKDTGLDVTKILLGHTFDPMGWFGNNNPNPPNLDPANANNNQNNQAPVKKGGILKRIKNWLDYRYGDMEL